MASLSCSVPLFRGRRRRRRVTSSSTPPWGERCTLRCFSTSGTDDGSGSDDAPASYPSRLLSRLSATSSNRSLLSDALPLPVALRAGASAFFGIGCLTGLHYGPWLNDGWASGDITMVLGSFGATAVLVYGYPAAPFSQPKNVVLGHVFSAACGIAAHKYLTPLDLVPACQALGDLTMGLCAPDLGPAAAQGTPILAAPVAVAAATMGMMAVGIVHPPAGGTCLIACMGSDAIHQLGWQFLVPTAFGSTFLCTTAFFINNVSGAASRRYPAEGWW